MVLTPHTLVGIAIGSAIQNPLVAVPIAIVSHHLGDLIPHWDFFYTKEEALKPNVILLCMVDLILGVAVGVLFTLYGLWVIKSQQLALNIFLCGIASVLPDVISVPSYFQENTNFVSRAYARIQEKIHFKLGLPWGLVTQVLVSLLAILSISYSLKLL